MVYWIVVLIALRALIGTVTPVFETSEARYAAISANMARTGDFLVPRFTYREKYQSYDGKPPLQFQLSGLSCRCLGVSVFAVRLPILLAMSGMLLFLYFAVSKLSDRRRGVLAAALCASSVAIYALMGFSMPDGLLTPCVATAYLAHLLFLHTGRRNWSLVVFAALALGMLDKGPVALVLFAFPVLVDTCVNHHWRAVARCRWLAELIARVQALVRRANPVQRESVIRVADLELDPITHRVVRAGRRIDLQPLEYQLLEYLMRNRGRIVSKTTIMDRVWDYAFDPHTNVVECRVSRLRSKISQPGEKELIHTSRGFGYVLEER